MLACGRRRTTTASLGRLALHPIFQTLENQSRLIADFSSTALARRSTDPPAVASRSIWRSHWSATYSSNHSEKTESSFAASFDMACSHSRLMRHQKPQLPKAIERLTLRSKALTSTHSEHKNLSLSRRISSGPDGLRCIGSICP